MFNRFLFLLIINFMAVLPSSRAEDAHGVSIVLPMKASGLKSSSDCSDQGDSRGVVFQFTHRYEGERNEVIAFYWKAYRLAYNALKEKSDSLESYETFFGMGPFNHRTVFGPAYSFRNTFPREDYDFEGICSHVKSAFEHSKANLRVSFAVTKRHPPRLFCSGGCFQRVEFEVKPTLEIQIPKNSKTISEPLSNLLRSESFDKELLEAECSNQPQPVCPPPYEG